MVVHPDRRTGLHAMTTTVVVALVAALGVFEALAHDAAAAEQRWTFTEHVEHVEHLGLDTPVTSAGAWKIEDVDNATGGRALINYAGDGEHPAIAVTTRTASTEFRATTKCRPSAEEGARSCGVVFRYRGLGDYDVARVDLDANALVLGRVRSGTEELREVRPLAADAGETWHRISVSVSGPAVQVWLDEALMIETTSTEALRGGAVGLWVPSRGSAVFDELRFTPSTTHRVQLLAE